MLTPDDERIVAADPALPEFATLLDPERLAAALGEAFPGCRLGPVTAAYLRYKPGTSCHGSYRMTIDGTPVDLCALTSSAPAKLRIRSGDRIPGGPFDTLGFRLGVRPIMVRVFPNDPSLKAMAQLACGSRAAWWPNPFAGARVETLRYKPERRWVARLTADAGSYCLKVHAPNRIAEAVAGTTAVHSEGPLVIAPTVHVDEPHGVVVQEWLDGSVLADLQGGPEWNATPAATVGAALAEVHRQGQFGFHLEQPATVADRGLEDLGATLGLLAPHQASRVRTHAATLVGALHELADTGTRIHGDFYAKQVLLTPGRAAILDFDQARFGDPAEDLGNFRAHLLRDVLRGRIDTARATTVWDHLLDGYGRGADDWTLRVQLFTAIGCLRLAPDPFRHREPAWANRVDELIELSVAALAPVLDANGAVECR